MLGGSVKSRVEADRQAGEHEHECCGRLSALLATSSSSHPRWIDESNMRGAFLKQSFLNGRVLAVPTKLNAADNFAASDPCRATPIISRRRDKGHASASSCSRVQEAVRYGRRMRG